MVGILDILVNPVKKFILDKYDDFIRCPGNVRDLEKEMKELESIHADLKMQVERAGGQGQRRSNQVQWWLDSVDKLVVDATGIKAQFDKRVRCMGEISLDLWSTYQISVQAKRMILDVKDLKERRNGIPLTCGEPDPEPMGGRTAGEVIGMESVLEELRSYVRDVNVSVIGVHGMAGVGKTELLLQLCNEQCDLGLDYVIWVDMPVDAEVPAVQKAVGQQLGIQWDESESREQRASLIFKILKNKKFVLILDAVWEFLDLKEVGIPVLRCPTESGIIVATRIESVCDSMGAKKKVKVKCLQWDDAWNLFLDKAGEELIRPKEDICAQAKELAKKCGGLPRAIIQVGATMASKKTLEEWRHSVTALTNAPWRLLGTELLTSLKLSYDKLTDDTLRTCLLYCSLYPVDHPIYKDWVTDYGIGEGIIDDVFHNVEEIYDKGKNLVGKLEVLSLLESCDDEKYIKMHPIIRGMALWVACQHGEAGNRSLVRAGAGLRVPPQLEHWRGAQRISLMRNDLRELPESPECPELVTLLLQRNSRLRKISDGFFQSMGKLRVLDLSHTGIMELPRGIEPLGMLRYLDLCGTRINSLPSELSMLKNLRFLLLSWMPYLHSIPDGLIAGLPELQVLYMYVSYGDWRVGSVGSGVNFNELLSLKMLKALELTIESVPALHRLLQSPRLATFLSKLHIRACPGLPAVLSTDIDMNITGLQCLQISYCSDLEEVVINGGGCGGDNSKSEGEYDAPFPSLHTLQLLGLPKAKIIWNGGCLKNLCYLFIALCCEMEQLFHCKVEETEEVEEKGGDPEVISALPCLKKMELMGLPRLKSLRCGRRWLAFPSLEILEVSGCPKLNKLELDAKNLREVLGSKSWWDRLEWEDKNREAAFAPLFKEKKLH